MFERLRNMMTKTRKIKDFTLDGEAVDVEAILRIRKELEERVVEDMRGKGYVPVIDLLPQLFWEYDKDSTKFSYSVTIYGTFVGKKESQLILGILDSRPILFENTNEAP